MNKNGFFRIVIVFIFLIVSYYALKTAPYYANTTHYDKNEVRVVLDDNEITKGLPAPCVFVDGKTMLSMDTIKKYIDKYIYYDEKYNTVIIAYGKYVAKMPIDDKQILVNDEIKNLTVAVFNSGDNIYVPIEDLTSIYNIDAIYNEKVIITTKNMERYSIVTNSKLHIKKYKRELSLTTDIVKKGETIEVYDDYVNKTKNEYLWIRTMRGDFGYVEKSKVKTIDSNINYFATEEKVKNEKVTLTWEYAENYTPNRNGESKIKGLDIIAPTWFYVIKEGNGRLSSRVDESYIRWARAAGYKLWPAVINSGGIDNTSSILNDMKSRETLINQIVTYCDKYNFDGINLDFENIYKEDKEEYAQLVRELSCTLRRKGIATTVDVNVPDGSDTWSLCYDTKAISDAADYTILMAYDQHGSSSRKAGSVASYAWVEANLKKLIEREKVDSEKLILGVPFYSRLWKCKNGSVSSTSSLSMESANTYLNKNNKWDDDAKQYLVEYTSGGYDIKVWVENSESLREKIKLIGSYNLAGVASWRIGYETKDVWSIVCDI